MNTGQYLKRINALLEKPSFNSLATLQKLHLQNVPFENLDVIRNVPIYLNFETIYKKIVEENRGGYCYELNGLFHSLLTDLGYTAHLISATVLRPNGEWAKADTHAAILVYLDKPYLVDVGFGATTPRRPIPLHGMTKTDVGETYKIVQQTETTFDLIREADGVNRTLYRFSNVKKELVDFHEGCVFNQVSKDSTFTHTDIVAIATETGRITLQDHTLTKVVNGVTEKTELSPEEKEFTLKNIFSLSLKKV
ncbi:arylamine N-acetyltransferase [Sporosarcina pasteurii]|uniref:Arylamine N-acetyltransferase n=1 Tax=Sporosarcina pasteurii TaxID=1474 RepID=A0A380BST6_SPOPA|nr:arylamine N-acetyltransferase [Sporosarcina pasteurii]MDS9471257.1 arylamine N-acetyltransferase [Sporosarcina pasteurii]QBQ05111.1 arylamine N-acetyltransferase [Sporosarcina pasteurii]SUJ06466.1 Arylamine N-acetyltransferase [Sporosarcina pasteurii]